MEGSYSGNSRQRKRARKAEERIADEVAKKLLLQAGGTASASQAETSSKQSASGQKVIVTDKISTFWASSPFWGGVGVLAGAFGSQLSLKLLFFIAWVIFLAEFMRVGFFEKRLTKMFGNAAAGVAFCACLFVIWQVTPKPKEPPTIDQEMDAFGRKFPFLGSTAHARSYIDIGPYEPGINSLPNSADHGKLFVNVHCTNVGEEAATLTSCGAFVFIYDGAATVFAKDKDQQEKYFKQFVAEYKPPQHDDLPRKLIPQAYSWLSPVGPIATQQLMDDLNGNKKIIVVVGQALYRDDHTNRKTDMCEFMQPPVTSRIPIWHACLVHTSESE